MKAGETDTRPLDGDSGEVGPKRKSESDPKHHGDRCDHERQRHHQRETGKDQPDEQAGNPAEHRPPLTPLEIGHAIELILGER